MLIPALAAAGGSGFALAKGRRPGLVAVKMKRMPLIAINGIFVLIPSALFLAFKAGVAEFDTSFYAIQALELAAGAANLTLLGLNMRWPQNARLVLPASLNRREVSRFRPRPKRRK